MTSPRANSEDEMNLGVDHVMNNHVRQYNIEPLLMDSDDESLSSFTWDDMSMIESQEQETMDRNVFDFIERWERQQPDLEVHQEDDGMDTDHDDDDHQEEPMDQEGGAVVYGPLPPLYRFDVRPLTSRRSQQMGVEERGATVQLLQNDVSHPQRYNLLEELALVLTQSIEHLLNQYPDDLDDRDRLYFTLGSTYLRPSYDGWGPTVGEWRHPETTHRVSRVFENLALMLNSNETFRMDDSFTLNLVVVKALPQGGGKPRKRRRIAPGEASADVLPVKKRTILQIPEDDRNMCCAEALWVAYKRATLTYREFNARYQLHHRKQRRFQLKCENFQRCVGIPLGTLCGHAELKKFAEYFATLDYCILVVDASRGNRTLPYGSGSKHLAIYHHNNHYHAIRSVKGFYTINYLCPDCYKTYNDIGSHRCSENKDHCPACYQKGCKDYVTYR